MKKLRNALADNGNYHCFGCSPDNPRGLKMQFWQDGDEVISRFDPEWYYEGWEGIMHGGIIATMMDELGAWLIFTVSNTTGVTTNLSVKYKKPVPTTEGPLEIRGRISHQKRNIIQLKTEVRDHKNTIYAEADITYFTFSEKTAREKYNFPGREAFYGKD